MENSHGIKSTGWRLGYDCGREVGPQQRASWGWAGGAVRCWATAGRGTSVEALDAEVGSGPQVSCGGCWTLDPGQERRGCWFPRQWVEGPGKREGGGGDLVRARGKNGMVRVGRSSGWGVFSDLVNKSIGHV
ncbi:hypothetical protein ZWY2020_024334 [Hordeum vulgare]|nr:hypothetical protein ZWY2020_024334 [Hordeum vulgare]